MKGVATLGSDIELFVQTQDSRIHSAVMLKMCEGLTKDNRKADVVEGFECGWHPDNISLEFQTGIFNSVDSFAEGVKTLMDHFTRKVEEEGMQVPTLSQVILTPETMGLPGAMEAGCSPDFNIYTLKPSELNPFAQPWRFAGGHIHIGLKPRKNGLAIDEEYASQFVRRLDRGLGRYLHALNRRMGQTVRDQVYGKLGTIRFKPYGFEYRTPSNLWAFEDESIRRVGEYLSDL